MKTKKETVDEFIHEINLLLYKYKNGEYTAAQYFEESNKLTDQLIQDLKD